MKKYKQFLNESLGKKKTLELKKIISFLNKNTKYTFAKYNEEFRVKKQGYKTILSSVLFMMIDENDVNIQKAIRFNFSKFSLFSIDKWENLEFNLNDGPIYNKPDYEMKVSSISADNISLFEFHSNNEIDTKFLEEVVDFINGDFELKESVKDVEYSPMEDVESQIDEIENIDIDIFEAIKYNTLQVAFNRKTTSFILSGLSGMGKTHDVLKTLDEVRMPYQYFKGNSTPAGLYELLFLYRKELVVLDDMDDALSSKDTADMLKSVLDTGEKRVLDRRIKGYFDAVGLTDEEIEAKYKKTGKLPNRFEFTGSIIFITNLTEENFDPNVYTRTISLDVRLEKEELLKRIEEVLPHMLKNIPMDKKRETLKLMLELLDIYVEKSPLNLRTLYHCLNFRSSNEFDINVDGNEVATWKLLVKAFLVRNVKVADIKDKKEDKNQNKKD